ncbi:hypothetical protein K439DRAFT_152152 [Ramaria rubella]|nr:hypothetical protein K439DRAFT_152152 [Ramaria rubella]
MLFKSIAALSFASAASAAVVTINVGASSGSPFVYTPNNVTAAVGDVINFQFTGSPGAHSVSQASFAAPCAQLAGGFDSGFVTVPSGFTGAPQEWNLTVTDVSKPIWFYCKQTVPSPHCIAGMVGAINAPGTGNTIEQFTSAAKALSTLPAQTSGNNTGGVGVTASGPPAVAGGSSSSGSGASATGPSSTSSGAPAASSTGSGKNSAANVAANGIWSLLAVAFGVTLA